MCLACSSQDRTGIQYPFSSNTLLKRLGTSLQDFLHRTLSIKEHTEYKSMYLEQKMKGRPIFAIKPTSVTHRLQQYPGPAVQDKN